MARILIVDDEEPLRALLRLLFEDAGHQVHTAINGRHALEVLREYQPDLVISDVMMPIMDGITLCHRLKSELNMRRIPVILMSAVSGQMYERTEANAIINKPFSLDTMEILVNEWLSTQG